MAYKRNPELKSRDEAIRDRIGELRRENQNRAMLGDEGIYAQVREEFSKWNLSNRSIQAIYNGQIIHHKP
jgi:hypothetical protein